MKKALLGILFVNLTVTTAAFAQSHEIDQSEFKCKTTLKIKGMLLKPKLKEKIKLAAVKAYNEKGYGVVTSGQAKRKSSLHVFSKHEVVVLDTLLSKDPYQRYSVPTKLTGQMDEDFVEAVTSSIRTNVYDCTK